MISKDPVYDYLAGCITDVLANRTYLYDRITAEVEALSTYTHCVGEDDCTVEECDHDTTMSDWPTLTEVGDVIVNIVRAMIDRELEEYSDLWMLVVEVLDLHASGIKDRLADHFYPEDARKALEAAGRW